MSGQRRRDIDADTAALAQRLEAHRLYGSRDLNSWVLDHMALKRGHSVIDLGAGTGEQTLPTARAVGRSGHVVAVDIAEESLAQLWTSAKAVGVEDRITLMCCDFNDVPGRLERDAYDRALGVYSLYYASHPNELFAAVERSLQPGGVFFFCGPTRDNNLELKRLLAHIRKEPLQTQTGAVGEFMEVTGPVLARKLFPFVDLFSFDSSLRFDSAAALYSYWAAHGLYDEALAPQFKAAASDHFSTHPLFILSKYAIGVRATKA